MAEPSAADIEALVILDFEMPSLRRSVELAGLIAEAVRLHLVRHPVLAFVLDKAPTAVVENLLLRVPEILEIMHRVRSAVGQPAVFSGRNRERKPLDDALRLAFEARQERVAHRVQFGLERQAAWKQINESYGSVWPLLHAVLDRFQTMLDDVRKTGRFDGVTPRRAARREYAGFTLVDLEELLKTTETLGGERRRATS